MDSEKENRKKRIRELNEPPHLTALEETGTQLPME